MTPIEDVKIDEFITSHNDAITTSIIQILPESDLKFLMLKNEITRILEFANKRVITSAEDVKSATEDLSTIANLKKALKGRITEYINPIKQHLSCLNETFANVTSPLEYADKITREKIISYRAAEEKKRLEIEDINRKKEELAKREAALNDGEITVDVTPIKTISEQPKIIRTDVGNLGTQKVWKFEIENIDLLPKEYMIPDMVKIGKVIRAGISITGIKSWQEESLRINTK
jgi:hypothetical protein